MAGALGSTLDLTEQLVILTRKLAEACGVRRCAIFFWDEAGLVTPVTAQFATSEANQRMWSAFKELGRLPLREVPFLREVMERREAIEIVDTAWHNLAHSYLDSPGSHASARCIK